MIRTPVSLRGITTASNVDIFGSISAPVVYVDDLMDLVPRNPHVRERGTLWCHLTTDGDLEELHVFAERMGIPRRAFHLQKSLPHYDLTPDMRERALALGAVYKHAKTQIRELRARRG